MRKVRSSVVIILGAMLFSAALASPCYAAQTVSVGGTCTQAGATAMNAAGTEILACLNGIWQRGSTAGINLNTIPAIPANQVNCLTPSVLGFDGKEFTCTSSLPKCVQGQVLTTYDGVTLNCANLNPSNNGTCGSGQYSCASGTLDVNSKSDNGTTSTWTCDGNGGGNNAPCRLADPVNGKCNNASQYACTTGTPDVNSEKDDGTTSTWTCKGSNNGTNDSCSMTDPSGGGDRGGGCSGPGDPGSCLCPGESPFIRNPELCPCCGYECLNACSGNCCASGMQTDAWGNCTVQSQPGQCP
jgi:hypothetical protein